MNYFIVLQNIYETCDICFLNSISRFAHLCSVEGRFSQIKEERMRDVAYVSFLRVVHGNMCNYVYNFLQVSAQETKVKWTLLVTNTREYCFERIIAMMTLR